MTGHKKEIMPRGSLWPSKSPVVVVNSMVKNWRGSLVTYAALGAVLGVYFTDWKPVARYIPFYGGKFPKEEA